MDRELKRLQDAVGCSECKYAEQKKIGFFSTCTHPGGWRGLFGQLTCINQFKINEKIFSNFKKVA